MGRNIGYTYDAWGNITGVYDKDGNPITNPDDVAFLNPLRYRSYYYDDETGLYYLNSRYYNPEWGRFISADAFADTGQGVIATNMYAYCLNNPVNLVDPTGLLSDYIKDIVTRPRKPININGNAFLNTANGFLNSNSQPANTTQSHASSTTQSSILSNPNLGFVCGVASDFNKSSLVAIADYKLGNIGSTSIGVGSFLGFVNDLGEDYYFILELEILLSESQG